MWLPDISLYNSFKVNDLAGASKSISVLPLMMDDDVKSDCVRKPGSHTRNLLRVKRGIDMVKVLFEHIISIQYVLFLSVVGSWCLCCVFYVIILIFVDHFWIMYLAVLDRSLL